LGKTIALRFETVRFLKKPALYALKTLNFKLTLPSLANTQKSKISGRINAKKVVFVQM
jgi:hypothetical protein